METQVKIILHANEEKSKNGPVFEELMSHVFQHQGYTIRKNINFTGLEIDLYATHNIRTSEEILIECKAKKKPQSTEIKNFAFNISFKRAKYGYFIYTENLDHQAAGLVQEIMARDEYKDKLVFIGPEDIISILEKEEYILPFPKAGMLKDGYLIKKLILLHSFFGRHYLVLFGTGAQIEFYSLLNAVNLEQINDINFVPESNTSNTTIEQILKYQLPELSNAKYRPISKSATLFQNFADRGLTSYMEMRESFINELLKLDVSFAHSQVDEITLEDIFVWPNARKLNSTDYRKKSLSLKAENVKNFYTTTSNEGIKYIFLGDDNSGKTSLAKFLVFSYYQEGYTPVYINGESVKNIKVSDIQKLVSDKVIEQYNSDAISANFDLKKVIIVIDNLHKINVKNEYKVVFIKNLAKQFQNIIATGSSLMPLEVLFKDSNSTTVFSDFEVYSILQFGPKLRFQIVEKWNSLGQENEIVDINESYRKNDFAIQQIDSILGKNYIPSYPFYLLTILQAVENANSQKPEYSMHGFYYELLINDSLAKAVEDKKEISFYYNYITNFCYNLFETKREGMTLDELQEFHTLYCNKFQLDYNFKKVISTLLSAKLIDKTPKFKPAYKYVYYFFVAKQITNNIREQHTKSIISKMCQRIHRDEYSNIIMFLTHLSKDSLIIDELINQSSALFSEVEFCKLQDDTNAVNSLISELPKKIIELIDTSEVRKNELEEREELEKLEKNFEAESSESHDIDEDVAAIDIMSKMTMALKYIDILGQVSKKYWGEMTGERKIDLVSKTYFLGLRTLGYVLGLVGTSRENIIKEVTQIVLKSESKSKGKQRLANEIEESVGQYVFRLCHLSTYGIVKRISTAVGYDKLKPTFDAILNTNEYNSIRLISLAINLEHFNKFPDKEIGENKVALERNYLGYTVLQNLVIDYLYMFDTDYKDKSRICNSLGIEIKKQLFIDSTSEVKRIS